MARPKKNNAEYYSHDKDMRNDPRIKALRKKYKSDGYSFYNFMLEVLTDSDDFVYELNDLNIELLSGDFDLETELLKSILEYCFLLNLFQKVTINDKSYIDCLQLRLRFSGLLSKRKRERKPVIADDNTQSKVEYSKVNNNIEDNNNLPEKIQADSETIILPESTKIQKPEKEKSSAKKEKDFLYHNCMEIYDQFIIDKLGIPAKIDGIEGKALKTIIAYIKKITNHQPPTDEDVKASFKVILDNHSKWSKFHQEQLKLSQINSNIINIINEVKNGKNIGNNPQRAASRSEILEASRGSGSVTL